MCRTHSSYSGIAPSSNAPSLPRHPHLLSAMGFPLSLPGPALCRDPLMHPLWSPRNREKTNPTSQHSVTKPQGFFVVCLFVFGFLFFYFLNFGVGSRSGQRFRLFLLYLKCSSPFPGATVVYWPSQTFGTLGERNEKLFVPIFQYITL